MSKRYNVYFAGELLEGHQLEDVRSRLAKLFNADRQVLDRLFSGKAQLVKRDCDEATALKYRRAMEQAGAAPILRQSPPEQAAPPPAAPQPVAPQPASPETAEARPMTAAERIAALAAAPDEERFRSDRQQPEPAQAPPADPGDPQLAPVGADLLLPDERSESEPVYLDLSGLEVGPPVDRLAPLTPPPPPVPDTAHMDMGEVGEEIPGLPPEPPPPVPDASGMDLAPPGSDLGPRRAEVASDEAPDLSGIELSPLGADVLEEQYRRRETADAPPTNHISMED